MIKQFNSAEAISLYIDSQIHGSFLVSDVEFLGSFVKQLKTGDKYMEIGTSYGKSTASAIWQAGEGVSFFTADIEDQIVLNQAKLSRKQFFEQEELNKVCTFIQGASLMVAERFTDNYFNMIFIDAEHTYEAGKADILVWTPKLRSGGFMVFHDYLDTQFTLSGAINELVRDSDQFTDFKVAQALGYGMSSMAGAVKI